MHAPRRTSAERRAGKGDALFDQPVVYAVSSRLLPSMSDTCRVPVRAAVPEHGPPRNDPPRLVTVGVSSTALASAYGIAVTGTLAIDTILFFVVARTLWHTPRRVVVSGATAFLLVDLAFFTANLPKVIHGGWFPLALAL